MVHVVLIGAGNMGFAMLRMWSTFEQHDLTVVEPNAVLRARAAETGARTYPSADDLPIAFQADVAVIATKPQVVGDVVERYSALLADGGLFISIAAGIGIQKMASRAKCATAIIRCMPNTPAAIGEGMIVCCPSDETTSTQRALAQELLSSIGRVAFVDDEALMDTVTAVSGSGPAYVFHFIETLCQAGIDAGLDDKLALLLAKQTVFGAAKLAVEASEPPAMLREQVTSPNGTTAAALDVLMEDGKGLRHLIGMAVQAARRRSVELGS
ncbi:pyrroline-5-carboxylate reductase [Agrobacterium rhizogenes]|uniref:Pyrroline-5-carboxylate reductase n=1 Tax=Rhizobium rhizogenes NBRC 13257 TaxID=1220581 RepID=A0AA87U857_RHIRH|nr:pyrroline-5-carboxylate reductase [Rhizobium rhizogenes]NTG64817.1 pyrroline-5-carboxylate reductase [Rhizobium rhizogenes]NTG71587.1 pyrroline-5-carboxylate reductase [Rhizobium rhizogenes]NTG84167.1 pyrroline-5-carboxylate reductase [Rhizobium rhizogenes]NTG90894.1 pyrroline-5-carboxylate reductase [Rhizobium rhizogenes]NTH29503.1 pyrroline-5-carboxylate reductase [Rhizobium rhizogenes]